MSQVYRTFLPDDAAMLATLDRSACTHGWSAIQYLDSVNCGHQFHGLFNSELLQGFAVTQQVLDEAELLNIVISQAWQGQQLGTLLLRELSSTLAAAGVRDLFLEVRTGNTPARRLYAAQGFVEIGRRTQYYPGRHGGEDAIVLRASL